MIQKKETATVYIIEGESPQEKGTEIIQLERGQYNYFYVQNRRTGKVVLAFRLEQDELIDVEEQYKCGLFDGFIADVT